MSRSAKSCASSQAELDLMAEQAFEAHAALVRVESVTPGLSGNPYWLALREAAFARFSAVYGKAVPR
jgi:hypothetical protein